MSSLTNEEVADIVEQEGLGYSVMDYLSSEQIEDEVLRALWENAADLLYKIDSYLGIYPSTR